MSDEDTYYEDELAEARAENERLREWQREVCDLFGYDSDTAGNADEMLAYLPFWKGEAAGYAEALQAAEAQVAAVRALHGPTTTGGFGPDYCKTCSDSAQEWVKWPCRVAAALSSPEVQS